MWRCLLVVCVALQGILCVATVHQLFLFFTWNSVTESDASKGGLLQNLALCLLFGILHSTLRPSCYTNNAFYKLAYAAITNILCMVSKMYMTTSQTHI